MKPRIVRRYRILDRARVADMVPRISRARRTENARTTILAVVMEQRGVTAQREGFLRRLRRLVRLRWLSEEHE